MQVQRFELFSALLAILQDQAWCESLFIFERLFSTFEARAMAATRAKNTANVKETARVLRGAVPSILDRNYLDPDLDVVCGHYQTVLLDLLKLTARPNPGLLKQAAFEVFGHQSSAHECNLFGDQMAAAISYCRSKGKSMTSGKKLPASVKAIVTAMFDSQDSSDISFVGAKAASDAAPRVSPPPTPARKLARDSSSRPSLLNVTPDDVRAMYGLGAQSRQMASKTAWEDDFVVLSSHEVLDSQADAAPFSTASSSRDAPPAMKSSAAAKPYFDASVNCMVRLLPNGHREFAFMSKGPGNFAIATFGKGPAAEVFDTEVPNLLLEAKPPPKLNVRKRPAAAMRKASVPSHSPSEQDAQTEKESEESSESSEEAPPPTIDYPGEEVRAPNGAAAACPAGIRSQYGLPPREKPKPADYVGGKLRITIVEKKSYITVQAQGAAKPTMLVGLEKRMADAHGKIMQQVILQIWDAIISEGIVSKDAACNKRQELLDA